MIVNDRILSVPPIDVSLLMLEHRWKIEKLIEDIGPRNDSHNNGENFSRDAGKEKRIQGLKGEMAFAIKYGIPISYALRDKLYESDFGRLEIRTVRYPLPEKNNSFWLGQKDDEEPYIYMREYEKDDSLFVLAYVRGDEIRLMGWQYGYVIRQANCFQTAPPGCEPNRRDKVFWLCYDSLLGFDHPDFIKAVEDFKNQLDIGKKI